MQTSRRDLFIAMTLAAIGFAVVVGVAAYSGWSIWQYWYTATSTCVACLSSVGRTFIDPAHLALVLLSLWSLVSLVRMSLFTWREYRFAQQVKRARPTAAGVHLVTGAQSAAWSAGIFSGSICVSDTFWDELTPEERVALVAHESWHIRVGDAWLFYCLGFAQVVFFDPLSGRFLRAFAGRVRLRRELAADASAIRQTSQQTVAQLLLKALTFESAAPRVAPGVQSVIHDRVAALTGGEVGVSPTRFEHSSVLLLCVSIGGAMAALPVYAQPMVQCLVG